MKFNNLNIRSVELENKKIIIDDEKITVYEFEKVIEEFGLNNKEELIHELIVGALGFDEYKDSIVISKKIRLEDSYVE